MKHVPVRPITAAVLTLLSLCAPLAGQIEGPVTRWQPSRGAWNAIAARDFALTRAEDPIQSSDVGPRRGRGAMWGAGIGLLAGGLLGGLTVESDGDDAFGEGLAEASATGEAVLLGAIAGAAIGALLGATVFAPSGVASEWRSGAGGPFLSPVVEPEALGLSVRFPL